MKMSGKLFVLLMILLWQGNALAVYHEVKTYIQKTWDLDFTGRYFLTEANYTAGGGIYQGLGSGYGYSLINFDFAFRTTYPGRNLAFYGGTGLSYAESKSPSASRSNAGLNYLAIGTDYILYQGSFALIPEFTFLYPLVRLDINQDAVARSEGAMEISAKIFAQKRWGSFVVGAFTGFIYRDEGRSSLLPYGIYGETAGKVWSFGANLKGFSSISYDKDTNNQNPRYVWASNYNGNSYMFYMPNPQILETNFWAQIKTTKKMNFLFGAGVTLNGANAASGWNLFGGATYRFQEEKEVDNEKSDLDKFQEETKDGVDQNLFKKGAPSKNQKSGVQEELDKTQNQLDNK